MNALARANRQHQSALKEGLRIVKKVVATEAPPTGLTTAEVFKLAHRQPPSADFVKWEPTSAPVAYGKSGNQRLPTPEPKHPEHPVRSMSFLKNSILPLLDTNVLRRVRVQRPVSRLAGDKASNSKKTNAVSTTASVWVWKPIDKATLPKPQLPQPKRKSYGWEVGVGEDWSHLNKRRQRARLGKVRREVVLMRYYDEPARAARKKKLNTMLLEHARARKANRLVRIAAEKAKRAEAARIRAESPEALAKQAWAVEKRAQAAERAAAYAADWQKKLAEMRSARAEWRAGVAERRRVHEERVKAAAERRAAKADKQASLAERIVATKERKARNIALREEAKKKYWAKKDLELHELRPDWRAERLKMIEVLRAKNAAKWDRRAAAEVARAAAATAAPAMA